MPHISTFPARAELLALKDEISHALGYWVINTFNRTSNYDMHADMRMQSCKDLQFFSVLGKYQFFIFILVLMLWQMDSQAWESKSYAI